MTVRRTGAVAVLALVMTSISPTGGSAAASLQATCRGVPATIVGSEADDLLTGTTGPDVIAGLGGDDIIVGAEGDDRICGGDGSDKIAGGAGNDRLFGEKDGFSFDGGLAGDALWGGAGDDLLNPGRGGGPDDFWGTYDQLRFSEAPAGVRVDLGTGRATGDGSDVLVVSAPVAVVGTPYDDVILGSGRTDRIVMLTGHDVVDGRGGNDWISVWDREPVVDRLGDDIRGGFGDDYIDAGQGDDEVRGDGGDDSLLDSAGVLDLEGGAGHDTLSVGVPWGKSGHRLDGGPGRDGVFWTKRLRAPDRGAIRGLVDLSVGSMAVSLREKAAEMTLVGVEGVAVMVGSWEVIGGPGNEWVSATYHRKSSLVARMGAGNDRVTGSGGDDVLRGGPGFDRVYWSNGTDVCAGFEVGMANGCA